jgi:hypothetical protein
MAALLFVSTAGSTKAAYGPSGAQKAGIFINILLAGFFGGAAALMPNEFISAYGAVITPEMRGSMLYLMRFWGLAIFSNVFVGAALLDDGPAATRYLRATFVHHAPAIAANLLMLVYAQNQGLDDSVKGAYFNFALYAVTAPLIFILGGMSNAPKPKSS